jgi:hypothetical protein
MNTPHLDAADHINFHGEKAVVLCQKHKCSTLLEEVNYDCILSDVVHEHTESYADTIEEVVVRHFGYGDIDTLVLFIDRAPGELIEWTEHVLEKLDIYPLYDERAYTDRQYTAACDMWHMARESERIYYCDEARYEADDNELMDSSPPDSVLSYLLQQVF